MTVNGWQARVALGCVLAALIGCGDSATERPTTFGGDRPVELRVPPDYAGEDAPLILVLHGYGVNGAVQYAYTRFDNLVQREGVLVLAPDGTEDATGNLYWNAEHPGCDIGAGSARPDDIGYLIGLLDEVAAAYNVDPDRVFVFGHSNGGFMAHRLACEHADRIAAIISMAGAPAIEPADCAPAQPVSVLQIHGDADTTVLYGGGDQIIGAACAYPGAVETVSRWAGHNGCTGALTDSGERLDLELSLTGDETIVERFDGCAPAAAELWTIPGGGHIPTFPNDVYQPMWEFLLAHAR